MDTFTIVYYNSFCKVSQQLSNNNACVGRGFCGNLCEMPNEKGVQKRTMEHVVNRMLKLRGLVVALFLAIPFWKSKLARRPAAVAAPAKKEADVDA